MNGPDRIPMRAIVLAELLATPAALRFAKDPNRSLLASMIAGQAPGTLRIQASRKGDSRTRLTSTRPPARTA